MPIAILYVACYAGVLGTNGCAAGTDMKDRRIVYLTDGSPGEASAIKAATVTSMRKENLPSRRWQMATKRGDWQVFWDAVSEKDMSVVVYVRRMSRDEWLEIAFNRPVVGVDAVEVADNSTLLIDVKTQTQKQLNKLRYAVNLEKRVVVYAIPYVEGP